MLVGVRVRITLRGRVSREVQGFMSLHECVSYFEANGNQAILGVCKSLVSDTTLDAVERELLSDALPAPSSIVDEVRGLVQAGGDPLGEAFMRVNRPEERRALGSVFTPADIVESMIGWAGERVTPARVVDCGCGSGRFALSAARRFPDAHIVATDISPLATITCKANAMASGVSISVVRGDFAKTNLPFGGEGPTLWIGNPPYVRHHDLTKEQKSRYLSDLHSLGVRGNALAGLHSHFVASIARRFGVGDVGCLVMSAEWMDVGYGAAIRDILTKRLAMSYLRVFDKSSEPFVGVMTSAVVVGFDNLPCDRHVSIGDTEIALDEFKDSDRWSDVVSRRSCGVTGEGYVRLGDIARVHRGVVTGRNSFWVRRPGEVSEQLSVPIVAHARELAGDKPACRDVSGLSRLVTLPDDISTLPEELYVEAEGIIKDGLRAGVDEGFVASHRKHWWSIKAPKAPAIMMTYMARHPPTFVVNVDGLGMLNVVHGIYPTVSLSDNAIRNLAEYLNHNVAVGDGRVYAGGLVKFEPREVEHIVVPSPEVLEG